MWMVGSIIDSLPKLVMNNPTRILPNHAFLDFLEQLVAAGSRQESTRIIQQGFAPWADQVDLYWDEQPRIMTEPTQLVFAVGDSAQLVLQRQRAYSAAERRDLLALSQLLAQLLAPGRQPWLSQLSGLESVAEVAQAGLAAVKDALKAESCLLFAQKGDRLNCLAQQGPPYPSDRFVQEVGIAVHQGAAWETYFSGQPLFIDQGKHHPHLPRWLPEAAQQPLAYYPIVPGQTGRPRWFLEVRGKAGQTWNNTRRQWLAEFSLELRMALSAANERSRLAHILHTIHRLTEWNREQTLQALLQMAVDLIPGAQAGSLVVRQGSRYYFRATVGFNLEDFSTITFTDADHRRWYGPDTASWLAGIPRIASNPENLVARSTSSTPTTQPGIAAHVTHIRSNLCLPIVRDGQVVAVINVDNFFDEASFAADSLRIAQLLSRSLAWLLHDSQQREQIREAAYLDTLTGMPNRRSFERDFAAVLQEAQQQGLTLALLMMDLSHFKHINDRLGHARGDEALIWVARVLHTHLRAHDQLYRWGGDEFVTLLPVSSVEAAHQIALRCARAVNDIQIEEMVLGINIGLSTYPQDGLTAHELLRVADQRMYLAKQEQRPLEGGEGARHHSQVERRKLE